MSQGDASRVKLRTAQFFHCRIYSETALLSPIKAQSLSSECSFVKGVELNPLATYKTQLSISRSFLNVIEISMFAVNIINKI